MIDYEPYPQITPEDTIIYVNNTSIKKLGCPRAFQFHNVRGYKKAVEDEVLTIGKAVHKYAQEYVLQKGAHMKALGVASLAYPTVSADGMVRWCAGRKNVTIPPPIMLENGRLAVELYFSVPWRRYMRGGKPYVMMLCGTIDLLGCAGPSVTVIDYKTSRRWDLDEITNDYKHDPQFKFYMWNLWKHGHMFIPLMYHNMIRDWKFGTNVVAVQVGTNRDPKWFKCPSILMNQDDMDEFEYLMEQVAAETLALHLLSEVADARGKVVGGCKYCEFAPLCHAKTSLEVSIAEKLFVQKNYDPRHHDE